MSFNALITSSNNIDFISYFSKSDSNLFLSQSLSSDVFFGNSGNNKDVIEVGIYDSSKNLVAFTTLTGSFVNEKVTYLYSDIDGNSFVDYYYKSNGNFIQNTKDDILLDVTTIISNLYSSPVSSSSLPPINSSFSDINISLNPIINLLSRTNPLIISEVSDSRNEVKLIKNFPSENVENDIVLTFTGQQILLNGSNTVNLKSGIVHRLIISGSNSNFSNIGFSTSQDGPILSTGTEYTNNIIYRQSSGEILLDTTQNFPTSLWLYNKTGSGFGCKITFTQYVDSYVFNLNTEFLSLDKSNFIYSQIYPVFEYYMNSFDVTGLFNSTVKNYPAQITALKNFYGCVDEVGVYDIIKSIFLGESYYDNTINKQINLVGIKDLVLNYLYFNYNLVGNFSTLQQQINRIVVYTVKTILLNKNLNSLKTINNYMNYYAPARDYLTNFFNSFLTSCRITTQSIYTETFKYPLRTALNFGDNDLLPILNSKIDYTDSKNLVYIVKLKDPLPSQFDTGSFCNVSNITFVPFFQDINYGITSPSKTVKLAYANFNIQTQNFQPSTSKKTPYYNGANLNISDTLSQQIHTVKTSKQFNVDFKDFSNFIVFSSAFLRIKIFENKMIKMSLLEQEIETLVNQRKNGNPPSAFTQLDGYNNVITLNQYENNSQKSKQLSDIVMSFDSYESYLYNEFSSNNIKYDINSKAFLSNNKPSTYVESLENSAYEYDKINRDNLANNTPEYMIIDEKNEEYLKFLNMIGHHFDNIYLYVANMNVYTQIGNDLDDGIPRSLISAVLDSFGMKLPPTLSGTIDDEEVVSTYLTGAYNSISLDDKTKIVWKRILTNLPQIYKTKGTEESINYILSCYGVPNNLIMLKEFGGGYTQPGIQSWRDVSEYEYFLKFVGNADEYVRIDQDQPCKSVDLKFSVSHEDYNVGDIIELYSKFDFQFAQNFSFGIIKSNETGGMFYILIKDVNGSNRFGYITEELLIFDGDITGVMIRKNHVNSNFENPDDSNPEIPVQYDIVVAKNSSIRDINTIKKYSFTLAGNLNQIFDTNNINVFGNTNAAACFVMENVDLLNPCVFDVENGSILFETENGAISSENMFRNFKTVKFVGAMDKFILSTVPINDEEFYTRCVNLKSYSDGIPQYTDSNTLFRFDMGYPTDISISSSMREGYQVYNMNQTYPTISASLFNFTGSSISMSFNGLLCVSQSNMVFPYQTQMFSVINQYNTSEVGPNRFENEKINKVSITSVENRLSPTVSLFNKTPDNHSKDSNKFGIFASPVQERDDDILNFMGSNEIVSNIADPRDRLSKDTEYNSFKQLRTMYYGDNNKTRVLFNELFIIYQTYIDKSIFQTLLNVLGGRNKIYSGILVEPTILERNKILSSCAVDSVDTSMQSLNARVNTSPLIGSDFIYVDTIIIRTPISTDVANINNNSISSSQTQNNISSNIVTQPAVHSSTADNNFSGFNHYNDVSDEFQLGTHVEHGDGVVHQHGRTYDVYLVNDTNSIHYSDGSRLDKRSQRLALIPQSSSFVTSSRYERYTSSYFNNISMNNLPSRKSIYYNYSGSFTGSFTSNSQPTWFVKSRQTSQTTINQHGQTNNSPVVVTVVGSPIINSPNIIRNILPVSNGAGNITM